MLNNAADRALWLAVIDRAIADLSYKEHRWKVLAWIANKNAFRDVCENAGLEPSYVIRKHFARINWAIESERLCLNLVTPRKRGRPTGTWSWQSEQPEDQSKVQLKETTKQPWTWEQTKERRRHAKETREETSSEASQEAC